MGVYIDTIRAKKIRALLHGQEVDVHAMKFFCKPFFVGMFHDELCKSQKMGLARAEKYWARRGLPRFVTYIDKDFEPDCTVIEWKGDFAAYDCDKTPGTEVGKLKLISDNSRKGFHWEIEANMLELNPT